MTIDAGVVVAAITALSAGIGAIARLVYMDLRRDRDFWRDMALALRDVNAKSVEVNEKLARRV